MIILSFFKGISAHIPKTSTKGGILYSIVSTAIVCGIQSILIQVEADVCDGLPTFEMVGVLSSEVKEAKERVKAAIRNSGIRLSPKRVTVNVYPADIKKNGTGFDLPIALAVLSAYGRIPQKYLNGILFAGEISLNGEIRPTSGILPMVLADREAGKHMVCVPRENLKEAQIVKEMTILPADNLNQVLALMEEYYQKPQKLLENNTNNIEEFLNNSEVDFADIQGQQIVKRACEIAASGRHNMLMMGPPGAGKTLAAKAISSILPPLTEIEALELAKIYSVSGIFEQREQYFRTRPFRSPHHTISVAGFAGGGTIPKPGEISLAHKGVLFLDELTEFQKPVLEVLRQPLEEGIIRLVRNSGTYLYPADVMLIGAMNPCNCGYYPDRNRCNCSSSMIERHLNKISKPLLDRMDICLEVKRLSLREMINKGPLETSTVIQTRVKEVQEIQRKRFMESKILYNSQIPVSLMEQYCPMESEAEKTLQNSFERLALSARGYYRVIRVARTIADMEHSQKICHRHIIESLMYRNIDRKVWELG